MDNKELEKKIKEMDLESIYNTSPKALNELTNGFCEPLVRLLMIKSVSISGQQELLKFLKKSYGIWQKSERLLWSEHPLLGGGYPEFFSTMEANIASDRIITASGSVSVGSPEYKSLISQQKEDGYSDSFSRNSLKSVIEAIKAEIPYLDYDKQNEKLSFVYREDKGKVNLDEVIEKKTKDFVDKRLEEMTATDDDIDEIFENVEEQNVLNQDNGNLLEDSKKIEGEEDSEDEKTDVEWDDQYDGVFNSNLKPQKIYIKLKNMNYPRVTDDYPRFFVFFRVLLYLGWIENQQKMFLKWTNCHWNCNWKKEHNFKFSNNILKVLRDTDMMDWDKNTSKDSDIGKAYRDFAKKVLDVLAENVNDGKIIDRVEFYKEGTKTRINDGRNLVYPF